MRKDNNFTLPLNASLRYQAAARLRMKTFELQPFQDDIDVRELYQELQIYKIELDRQNEELQRVKAVLAANENYSAKQSGEPCGCLKTIEQLQKQIAILTQRELQVLREITTGQCTKTVARQLNISPRTVDEHRAHILKKLGFTSLSALLASPIKCLLAQASNRS